MHDGDGVRKSFTIASEDVVLNGDGPITFTGDGTRVWLSTAVGSDTTRLVLKDRSPSPRVLEDELAEEAVDVAGTEQRRHDRQQLGRAEGLGERRPAVEPEHLGDDVFGIGIGGAEVGLGLGHDQRVIDGLATVVGPHERNHVVEHRLTDGRVGEAVDLEEAVGPVLLGAGVGDIDW